MIAILRWSGIPSRLLSQRCTICSETRNTSSVFAIYVMAAFVIILGSLHVPCTTGHKLEDHWKDTVHRKKTPTLPAYEQRRSHGLHSPSRTFQKENDRISPNRSTTNAKKRDRVDKSPFRHTKEGRMTTSWLPSKDHGTVDAESHDAVATDSFSTQVPDRGLPVRDSIERKTTRASFWRSRLSSKATFYPRSTETSASVTDQKEMHSDENEQVRNNDQKSVRFRSTMTSGQGKDRISHDFQTRSSPGLDRDQAGRNTSLSNASNGRSKVSPVQQTTSNILPATNLGTAKVKVTSNQPTIDPHSPERPTLPSNTSKLKDKSSDLSTGNIEIKTTHQDATIDSLKTSWSPLPSLSTKSHHFQRSRVTHTPTQALLTLSKKLKSQINLSSLARDADDEQPVPTVYQKGSSLIPVSVDTVLSATDDSVLPIDKGTVQESNMSNAVAATTRTERKRQRRKKNKNKRRRKKMNKTRKKKLSSNPQPASVDKGVFPNSKQMSTTKSQAIDAEDQKEQRLKTSTKSDDGSTGEASFEINTPLAESKTSRPWLRTDNHQQVDKGPSSRAVDPEWSDKMDYAEITEGSAEDELTRLERLKSESRVLGSDRKQKRLEAIGKRQFTEHMRHMFRTGLPPDGQSEPDLTSLTNRSPSAPRSLPKRRRVRIRDRNTKGAFFQKTKVPKFESSESSIQDPTLKDFSRLHFARVSSVLKTTVKRSARPLGAITPTPSEKKGVTDSKRWRFQIRKRKNKTNDSRSPNRETRIGDATQSSSGSGSVKKVVIHSKGHSLFDHDWAARREHVNAQTIAALNKQTKDHASTLNPFIEDNGHTLKSKTSSPLSEDQSDSPKMFSAISSPPTKNPPGWHRSTQIGSYGRKHPPHATTTAYDRLRSEISTSLPFAYDKKNSDGKKVGLLVTQAPNSIINDTTQVPVHSSSRITRGTDRSKSSQTLPTTTTSNRDHDATVRTDVYRKRKTDPAIEKDSNVQLPSTFTPSISQAHSQTTKSSTLSSTEMTPVQPTQQTIASRAPSQRPTNSSKFTQRVTISGLQTDNPNDTTVQNGIKIDGPSSPSPSTSITRGSSGVPYLHEEHGHTTETMSKEGFVKERSTIISTPQVSEDTSTPLSTTWAYSTPGSKSNKQSPEKHGTNKQPSSTESETTESAVVTHNSNLETSRQVVTSAEASDPDNKTTPHGAISHDDQHYLLHPTTSSPSSVLTSSTSKSASSLSPTTNSVRVQSTPTLSEVKSSTPFIPSTSFDDILKIITTPPLVRRTSATSITTPRVSSVTKEKQDNQHESTTKPLTKRPQKTTNESTKIQSTTFTMSPTTKPTTATRRVLIASSEKNSKKPTVTTRKPFKPNRTPTTTFMAENFGTTPGRKTTKNNGVSKTTLSNTIIDTDESVSTPDSVSPKPKDGQPKSPRPPSTGHEKLLLKCKVKSNIDIDGNDFMNKIKNGLVYSYLEGRTLLNQRKAGSTNRRRKREAIDYGLKQSVDAHAVTYGDPEGIEAKLLHLSRRGQLVEIYFQMLEYGLVIATDTAITVFSQLQITEISVNLHYPIYHQIEAIKQEMSHSQQPLKPSATKWMMVTIAAPSIPVLCVICILLTSWYRNHARLRRKAMAEISRGSQYAESLADVGLEIDMEKGEIVSRAGSTSVLWTEFAAGDTLERMGMAGDYPNTDGESLRSNSWNARGDSRTGVNPSGRGRRQSPVAKQCQRSGKYVKKKDSVSSFHFDNNLEDECPPVYESFEPALNDVEQWPRTSTLQSRSSTSRKNIDQQRKDNSSKSQIYGDSVIISSQKLRPTLHANIISHFLAELDTM